jgi:preprotein translocase subunit SecA
VDLTAYQQALEEWTKRREQLQARYQEITDRERDEVKALGGLFILGTERHESRRIDNQLRGRSGRQGDPGESRFFLSLQDDLMRLFATGMVERMMDRLKIPEDTPIEAKMVSKAIERAQRQREAQNFEIRKNVLKYDDVINKQREAIYDRRNQLLDGEDISELAERFVEEVVEGVVGEYLNVDLDPSEWDLETLCTHMATIYPTQLTGGHFAPDELTAETVIARFVEEALEQYDRRAETIGEEQFREIERRVLLNVLDSKWREHLYEMDYLQEGIGLRAVGQRDPLVEYQREGFDMFNTMQETIKDDFVQYMFHVEVAREQRAADGQQASRLQYLKERAPAPAATTTGTGVGGVGDDEAPVVQQAISSKVPRNAPCPCGSGKKYKKCHGIND